MCAQIDKKYYIYHADTWQKYIGQVQFGDRLCPCGASMVKAKTID